MRPLLIVVLLLFQSHWLDDFGTGEGDAAGITVSVIGSMALVIGLVTWHRLTLASALVFVVLVSLADLVGVRSDGSRAPNLLHYWQSELGSLVVLIVATTLACAGIALVRLARTLTNRSIG